MGGPRDYSPENGTGEENGKQNARLRTPSRDGTRLIAGHFEHAVSHQLRIIAAEEEVTIQALLAEALDLLFRKRGRPEINELRNNNSKEKK